MKNEGLCLKIWVITPKNEGFGFPWKGLFLDCVFVGVLLTAWDPMGSPSRPTI